MDSATSRLFPATACHRVRLGLRLIFFALFPLYLIASDNWRGRPAPTDAFLSMVTYATILSMFLASTGLVILLISSREVGGKYLLLFSLIAGVFAQLGALGIRHGLVSAFAGTPVFAIGIASLVSLVFFLRRLARDLQRADLVKRTARWFQLCAITLVCSVISSGLSIFFPELESGVIWRVTQVLIICMFAQFVALQGGVDNAIRQISEIEDVFS